MNDLSPVLDSTDAGNQAPLMRHLVWPPVDHPKVALCGYRLPQINKPGYPDYGPGADNECVVCDQLAQFWGIPLA